MSKQDTGLEWAVTFSEPAFCTEQCPNGQPGSEFPCPAVQGRQTSGAIEGYIEGTNGYTPGLALLAARTIPALKELAAACAVRVEQNGKSPIKLGTQHKVGDVVLTPDPFPIDEIGILIIRDQ